MTKFPPADTPGSSVSIQYEQKNHSSCLVSGTQSSWDQIPFHHKLQNGKERMRVQYPLFSSLLCVGRESGDKTLTTNGMLLVRIHPCTKHHCCSAQGGSIYSVFTLTLESSLFIETNWVITVYTTVSFIISLVLITAVTTIRKTGRICHSLQLYL